MSSLQLRKNQTADRLKEQSIRFVLFSCAAFSILTTVAIIFVLVSGTLEFFRFPDVSLTAFLTGTEWYPLSGKPKYGVLPIAWDTIYVAFVAGVFGLPIGLAIAIYLSEYASPRARGVIKPILEILAGIPTVVYGFFAASTRHIRT